jgi:hypothetical protein
MPLAKTRAERQRQGALDTAKKMRLEIPFARDIRRILKAISDDFYVEYIRSGTVIDVNAYRDDLNGALKKNYRNIVNKFKNNLRSEKAIDENIEGSLKQYIDTHSVAQTRLILNTTNELLNMDLRGSIFALAQSGQDLTNENIADLTWKKNSARVAGRAKIISATETQNMAETTKQTEANELAVAGAVVAGVAVATQVLKKRWNANLDERTRLPHVVSDGQIRNITQPFIVNGQLLNYPADSSLGASASNTVNCRCWVTYEV